MKICACVLFAVILLVAPVKAGGDADCNGKISLSDAVYLINYIFNGGKAPQTCADSVVVLTWTMPRDSDVVQYEVRWAWDLNRLLGWDSAAVVQITDSNIYAGRRSLLPIWGIVSDSTYYIALKTKDRSGNWSEISNITKVIKK